MQPRPQQHGRLPEGFGLSLSLHLLALLISASWFWKHNQADQSASDDNANQPLALFFSLEPFQREASAPPEAPDEIKELEETDKTDVSEEPEEPDELDESDESEESEEPDELDEPEELDESEEPEEPEEPDEPDEPDEPEEPEEPDEPDEPKPDLKHPQEFVRSPSNPQSTTPRPTNRISDADLRAEIETRAPVPSTVEGPIDDPAETNPKSSPAQTAETEVHSTLNSALSLPVDGQGTNPIVPNLDPILASRSAQRAVESGSSSTTEGQTAPLTVADERVRVGAETRLNANATALGKYLAKVDQQIRSAWILPLDLRAMGIQGTVEIAFTVNRWGRVSDPRIVRKSGNTALDQVALRAIPSRFPRIPRRLSKKSIQIAYQFRSTDSLIVKNPEGF
jgi:TonB family protein